ncbi:hypothetical protein U2181_15330, partial [Listeria monocytogenes]|uniref:hypothetical protein n=1 Tax=Listeria monocytogenes TaxID=1639 RepID=UPI002FDC47FF
VEQFMLDYGMRPTTFSKLAMKERHFVARLRKGAPVMSSKIVRVRQFMASYRPPVRARGNVRLAAA